MRPYLLTLSLVTALLAVGCDETTDTKDVAQVEEDLTASEDVPQNPSGYQGLVTLCPVIATCDFGFTEESCQSEFLSFCKDATKKATYLDCMSDCYDTYQTGKSCDAFRSCESTCWNDSGC